MTAIDRLITNVNSVIYFLKAFSDPAPQDVTFTWINDDDTTTDITYANIKKFQDSIANATGMEASDILNKLKTVDGENSELDADLLDGLHASEFARASGDPTKTFKAADAVEDDDVVTKRQLDATGGTILQVVSKSVGEIITVNSSSFVNVSNSLKIAINPKKIDSKIIVIYTFGHSVSTNHHTTSFRLLQNGHFMGTPTPGGGSRPQGSVSVRGQYNRDNASSVTIMAEMMVQDLHRIVFSLEGRCASAFTIGASQANRSDPWGWKVPTQITVMEIGA